MNEQLLICCCVGGEINEQGFFLKKNHAAAGGASSFCSMCRYGLALLVSVVVGLEGAGLVQAHVLCLLVRELGEPRVEGGEVEGGHELVHQLGHQVDVCLVATGGGVEQLWKQKKEIKNFGSFKKATK